MVSNTAYGAEDAAQLANYILMKEINKQTLFSFIKWAKKNNCDW